GAGWSEEIMAAERSTPGPVPGRERAAVHGGTTRTPGRRRLPTTLRALVFVNPVAPNADLPRLRAALDREFGQGTHRLVETLPRKDFAAEVVRELDAAAAAGC